MDRFTNELIISNMLAFVIFIAVVMAEAKKRKMTENMQST